MAQERYTRTNQKIYFAGLAIKALREAELSEAIDAPGKAQAEREAALFHLHGALLSLLQEIAGFYRLPGADVPEVNFVLALHSDCPELSELRQLASNDCSWMSALQAAYASLFTPSVMSGKAIDQGKLIATSSAQAAMPITADRLLEWQAELKTLALRFRETMVDS